MHLRPRHQIKSVLHTEKMRSDLKLRLGTHAEALEIGLPRKEVSTRTERIRETPENMPLAAIVSPSSLFLCSIENLDIIQLSHFRTDTLLFEFQSVFFLSYFFCH